MQSELARRRRELMDLMGPRAIAILPGASEKLRNRDTHFPFRQDSDFWYLTGFPEPDAVAVLVPGRAAAEYILFCRDKDPVAEAWDGRRAGPEGAVREYGADDAFPSSDLDDILPGLIEQAERVYYTMGTHPAFDQQVIGWVNELRSQAKQGRHTPLEFVALDHLLHDMRLYKRPPELDLMRRAASITAAAHVRAMRATRPGLHEYEIEAELLYEFRRHGGTAAYPSIVGGGANACVLHYRDNRAPLAAGDLVLVDAGCEFDHYAADLTRTWPVSGRFSPEQRAVYDVVLHAQEAAIRCARPGRHWNEVHEAAVAALTRGLVGLGLLEGAVERLIADQAYKPFYMHRTGHWLGIDVHDVGDYKVGDEWRVLEPGMVMTVEPGLYLAPGQPGVPKRLQGIGVRIEDDVLVTRGEPEVLTAAAPKDADAIEALLAAAHAA